MCFKCKEFTDKTKKKFDDLIAESKIGEILKKKERVYPADRYKPNRPGPKYS